MLIPVRDDNPVRHFPFVTVMLIAFNLLVYYLQLKAHTGGAGAVMMQRYALYPNAVTAAFPGGGVLSFGVLESLLTHMFLHGGILHLAGNMLFLWIFGNNVEDALGGPGYLLFYLASGLAAAAVHIAVHPSSGIPVVGASGAVAGVLGAYMIFYPGARVTTLFLVPFPFFLFWGLIRFVNMPALLLLGMWFVIQFVSGMAAQLLPSAGSQVAYHAHVGGFIAGAFAALLKIGQVRDRSSGGMKF